MSLLETIAKIMTSTHTARTGQKEGATTSQTGRQLLNKDGFTFLEILIVIIVLGVIAGFSIPRFHETFNNLQLKMAAYDLAQFFQYSQGEALREGRTHKIVLDGQAYWIMKENDEEEFERISGRWGRNNLINNNIEVISEKNEIYFYPEGRIDRMEINLKRGEKTYILTTKERQGYVEIQEK